MTTKLLRDILIHFRATAHIPTEAEYEQISDALAELDSIESTIAYDDLFKYECYIMHAEDACDYMNLTTYDVYGQLFVKNAGKVTYEQYAAAVIASLAVNHPSEQLLQLGYDIVSDLYNDNEAQGCHKPDGTFNYERI